MVNKLLVIHKLPYVSQRQDNGFLELNPNYNNMLHAVCINIFLFHSF